MTRSTTTLQKLTGLLIACLAMLAVPAVNAATLTLEPQNQVIAQTAKAVENVMPVRAIPIFEATETNGTLTLTATETATAFDDNARLVTYLLVNALNQHGADETAYALIKDNRPDIKGAWMRTALLRVNNTEEMLQPRATLSVNGSTATYILVVAARATSTAPANDAAVTVLARLDTNAPGGMQYKVNTEYATMPAAVGEQDPTATWTVVK